MDRRTFLAQAAVSSGLALLAPALASCATPTHGSGELATGATAQVPTAGPIPTATAAPAAVPTTVATEVPAPIVPEPMPAPSALPMPKHGYGELLPADTSGLLLPAGFSSRVIARTGDTVGPNGVVWHKSPDGGATFAQPDGGWIYVSNAEIGAGGGGVSMVRFNEVGEVIDARPILQGTTRNCAGGATPWGTWLSCEETEQGRVWECDPTGASRAVVHPAMGVFKHEAAAADAATHVIYLTEDEPDGLLYRFSPTAWGSLTNGVLEVLTDTSGEIGWERVPDPGASTTATRHQVTAAKRFAGGEGAWFDGSLLYFTTKGDDRVWTYDSSQNALSIIYDRATAANPILSGVDNVTVSGAGEVFVCEDGGDMEIVVLTPEGDVEPFLRLPADGSELTGVAFDPSGSRLYFSSQRNPGTTYEVSGPFRSSDRPSGS